MKLKRRNLVLVVLSFLLIGGVCLSLWKRRPNPYILPVIYEEMVEGVIAIRAEQFEGIIFEEKATSAEKNRYEIASCILHIQTEAWTPLSSAVARAERRILGAFVRLSADPHAVIPGIIFDDAHRSVDTDYIYDRLSSYRRQYVGLTIRGKRYLLINCFVANHFSINWRHEFIRVWDGGPDYWRILYDVEQDRCVDFDCNGSA